MSEPMNTEIWKPVIGTGGKYEVSNQGRVRSHARSETLTLSANVNSRGYLIVHIYYQKGIRTSKTVHSLVLEAFAGPRPGKDYDANHKNGNRCDNRLENLEWVTHTENVRHGVKVLRHKLPMCGERNGRAKLTWAQVREIRAKCVTNRSKALLKELANRYSVGFSTLQDVVYNRNWKENGG
jgi:hypothetical protein